MANVAPKVSHVLLPAADCLVPQESINRLAALVALGPPAHGNGDGGAQTSRDAQGSKAATARSSTDQPHGADPAAKEAYLAEVLDQLLECRVAEAVGELASMAVTVLLGPVSHGEQLD